MAAAMNHQDQNGEGRGEQKQAGTFTKKKIPFILDSFRICSHLYLKLSFKLHERKHEAEDP